MRGGPAGVSGLKQGNLKMSLLSHLLLTGEIRDNRQQGQRAVYFTREKYLLKTHV